MNAYYPFLAALVALLIGLTVGKAWERYKLRAGRLIDRRRVPESLHYIVGLNFLVTNQIDLAIEELSKAAESLGDALEIHLLLGSLYREKGQVARAINIHQSLLQRPRITRLEQAHILLCLGLDFKRGGFVDRALEAFNEVIRIDPNNQYALLNIEKLHEDQHQWQEAYDVRRTLGSQGGAEDGRSQAILAFLENELGLQRHPCTRRQNGASGEHLGTGHRPGARARVPDVRSTFSRVRKTWRAGAVLSALPQVDCREPSGLAREARTRQTSRGSR
jgi:lipopolysaccharide biosynthesis regulator YciM